MHCASPLLIKAAEVYTSDNSREHRVKLMDLISVPFLRPLLSNYAFTVTDKHDARKYFAKQPLSRKYARLYGATALLACKTFFLFFRVQYILFSSLRVERESTRTNCVRLLTVQIPHFI